MSNAGGFRIKCSTCSNFFNIDPPGSEYLSIIKQPWTRQDSITKEYNLTYCESINKIIWDRDHSLPFQRDASAGREKDIVKEEPKPITKAESKEDKDLQEQEVESTGGGQGAGGG